MAPAWTDCLRLNLRELRRRGVQRVPYEPLVGEAARPPRRDLMRSVDRWLDGELLSLTADSGW